MANVAKLLVIIGRMNAITRGGQQTDNVVIAVGGETVQGWLMLCRQFCQCRFMQCLAIGHVVAMARWRTELTRAYVGGTYEAIATTDAAIEHDRSTRLSGGATKVVNKRRRLAIGWYQGTLVSYYKDKVKVLNRAHEQNSLTS